MNSNNYYIYKVDGKTVEPEIFMTPNSFYFRNMTGYREGNSVSY